MISYRFELRIGIQLTCGQNDDVACRAVRSAYLKLQPPPSAFRRELGLLKALFAA